MISKFNFLEMCQKQGISPFIISKNENISISYANFYHSVLSFKKILEKEFPIDNEIILTINLNVIESAIFMFSCLVAGKRFYPVNNSITPNQLDQIMIQNNISKNIDFKEIDSTYYHLKNELKKIVDQSNDLRVDPKLPKNQSLDFNKGRLILSTSGSSGLPKGVILSFKNLFWSAKGSNDFYNIKPSDCWGLCLPLFHIGGLIIFWRCFLSGATVIQISNKPNSKVVQNINYLSLVPTQLQNWLSEDLFEPTIKYLKAVLVGGAACSKHIFDLAYTKKIPLSLTYGSTESCSQLSATKPGKNDFSCGTLLNYRKLKIDNSTLYISGKVRFEGYLGFNPIGKEENWFKTNDLGKISADRLQILGRKDRHIIKGGENISLNRISEIIMSHFPEVSQCFLDGVPCETYGEVPCLIIMSEKPYNYKNIKNYLNKNLEEFKHPSLYFWLPLNLLQEGVKPTRNFLFEQIEDYFGKRPSCLNKIFVSHSFIFSKLT